MGNNKNVSPMAMAVADEGVDNSYPLLLHCHTMEKKSTVGES